MDKKDVFICAVGGLVLGFVLTAGPDIVFALTDHRPTKEVSIFKCKEWIDFNQQRICKGGWFFEKMETIKKESQ